MNKRWGETQVRDMKPERKKHMKQQGCENVAIQGWKLGTGGCEKKKGEIKSNLKMR